MLDPSVAATTSGIDHRALVHRFALSTDEKKAYSSPPQRFVYNALKFLTERLPVLIDGPRSDLVCNLRKVCASHGEELLKALREKGGGTSKRTVRLFNHLLLRIASVVEDERLGQLQEVFNFHHISVWYPRHPLADSSACAGRPGHGSSSRGGDATRHLYIEVHVRLLVPCVPPLAPPSRVALILERGLSMAPVQTHDPSSMPLVRMWYDEPPPSPRQPDVSSSPATDEVLMPRLLHVEEELADTDRMWYRCASMVNVWVNCDGQDYSHPAIDRLLFADGTYGMIATSDIPSGTLLLYCPAMTMCQERTRTEGEAKAEKDFTHLWVRIYLQLLSGWAFSQSRRGGPPSAGGPAAAAARPHVGGELLDWRQGGDKFTLLEHEWHPRNALTLVTTQPPPPPCVDIIRVAVMEKKFSDNLVDGFFGGVCALFDLPSFVNHSCVPNAQMTRVSESIRSEDFPAVTNKPPDDDDDDKRAAATTARTGRGDGRGHWPFFKLVATRDILRGQAITRSYRGDEPLPDSPEGRRAIIEAREGFECRCSACLSITSPQPSEHAAASGLAGCALSRLGQCAWCGRKCITAPLLCGACRAVRYCNRACQKAHWNPRWHKAHCKQLGVAGARVP